jgi:hypothetical protein
MAILRSSFQKSPGCKKLKAMKIGRLFCRIDNFDSFLTYESALKIKVSGLNSELALNLSIRGK